MLAAGASRRFGSQKLLAPLREKPIVRWTVENVLGACPDEVVVVLGREGVAVREALHGLAVRFVVNEHWEEGMSSSLGAGISALPYEIDAAMIALGDQPGIEADVMRRLIEAHGASSFPIAAPSYRGERGNPVVFAVELFPELLAIRGDRGAKGVIDRDPSRVALVHFDMAPPTDVDTRADLRRAL